MHQRNQWRYASHSFSNPSLAEFTIEIIFYFRWIQYSNVDPNQIEFQPMNDLNPQNRFFFELRLFHFIIIFFRMEKLLWLKNRTPFSLSEFLRRQFWIVRRASEKTVVFILWLLKTNMDRIRQRQKLSF